MKFFKDEKGLTKIQFTIVAIIVMIIVAFTILLALGEDGFSLKTKPGTDTKIDANVENNENEQKEIDDTVYKN